MDAWAYTEIFEFFTGLWSREDAVTKSIDRINNRGKKK